MSHADDNDLIFLQGQPLDPEDVHEVHQHVSPKSLYVKILAALFVLTGLTYAVSYLSLGPLSLPVAMLVALFKATLVATFFMHLKGDERYHTFVFVSSLLFVGIFFTFVLFDLGSRTRLSEEQGTFFQRKYDPQAGMSDRQPGLMYGATPAPAVPIFSEPAKSGAAPATDVKKPGADPGAVAPKPAAP